MKKILLLFRKSDSRRLVSAIFCLILLLYPIWVQAADYVDTLYAAGDTASDCWQMTGFGGGEYERIDEEGSPNTSDYIYATVENCYQDWYYQDFDDTTGKIIDSVKFIYYAMNNTGNSGARRLKWRRAWYYEGGWLECFADGDTFDITAYWDYYDTVMTQEPCSFQENWSWWAIVGNDGGCLWGVKSHRVRSGPPFGDNNMVAWAPLIVYSHTEVAGDKSKERRERLLREGANR